MPNSTHASVSLTASKYLVDALKDAARLTPKKTTLRVLEHVKVVAHGNDITIECTDLKLHYRRKMFLPDLGADQAVTILIHRSSILTMKAPQEVQLSNDFYVIGGIKNTPDFTSEDFPKFREMNPFSTRINLPFQYFDDFSACATSAAVSEVRPLLTGICHRGNAIFATDGLRLCLAEQDTSFTHDINVPAIHAKMLHKAFGKSGAYLSYDGTHAFYKGNGFEISVRLIDGHYPDVSRITPNTHKALGSFSEIGEWIESLDRVLLLHKQQRRERDKDKRDASNLVQISSDGKGTAELSVKGVNQEFTAELPLTMDMPFSIACNAQYLKDALEQIGSAAIFEFNGSDKPMLFTSPPFTSSYRRKALVAPIRMEGDKSK